MLHPSDLQNQPQRHCARHYQALPLHGSAMKPVNSFSAAVAALSVSGHPLLVEESLILIYPIPSDM